VQVVFVFFIVQDLPAYVTLLPVILDPPFDAGREIFTVTFTLPFFGLVDVTETIVGAEGFVTFALVTKA
jgi:hypothetical protein